MRYWWVNHKQTFKQEFEGNYLWSPQVNANGAYNRYYENMLRASEGDIVLSYASTRIQGIGVVTARAILEPKPEEFGLAGANWNRQGWMLPVSFIPFSSSNRLRPADHIALLGPVLPPKYSPILSSGRGSQGAYLAELPEAMILVLIQLLGNEWHSIIARLQDEAILAIDQSDFSEIDLVYAVEGRSDLEFSTKKQLINARVGQGLYRKRVSSIEGACRVTGVDQLIHLRASHIKPWRMSTDHEKLDGDNGLMLSPHVDHLFDKGYIGFRKNGSILLSGKLNYDVMQKWNLSGGRNVGKFSQAQSEFLQFHEEFIFKS